MLAVCSLGGAGHLGPLTAFLDAAARRGDITAVLAPASMASHVEATGVDHLVDDEPPETVVAAIREQLPVASPERARLLAERELFARLAAGAMLPAARRPPPATRSETGGPTLSFATRASGRPP